MKHLVFPFLLLSVILIGNLSEAVPAGSIAISGVAIASSGPRNGLLEVEYVGLASHQIANIQVTTSRCGSGSLDRGVLMQSSAMANRFGVVNQTILLDRSTKDSAVSVLLISQSGDQEIVCNELVV